MQEQQELMPIASFEDYLSAYYPRLSNNDPAITASPTVMGVTLARESLQRNLATIQEAPGDEE